MNYEPVQDNSGERWVRVHKTIARKAYDSGEYVTVCPVNLHPFVAFNPSVTRAGGGEFSDFDLFVRNATYYGCGHEAGRYLAFYIKVQP